MGVGALQADLSHRDSGTRLAYSSYPCTLKSQHPACRAETNAKAEERPREAALGPSRSLGRGMASCSHPIGQYQARARGRRGPAADGSAPPERSGGAVLVTTHPSAFLDTPHCVNRSSHTEQTLLPCQGREPKPHRPPAALCLGQGLTPPAAQAPETHSLPWPAPSPRDGAPQAQLPPLPLA